MRVNECDVTFQLDTAADVNTICQKYVKHSQAHPTSQKLIMWNKSDMRPLGEATLTVINPKNGEKNDITFTIVQNDLSCLLGLKTI